MEWYLAYGAAWLAAFLLSAIFVKLCLRFAEHLGFQDAPRNEAHKNHKKATPVLGGLGMLAGWLLTIAAGLLFCRFLPKSLENTLGIGLGGISSVLTNLLSIALGAILITFLGILDDRKAMKALPKFLGQAAVAAIVVSLGMRTSFLHFIPGANHALTILWIMTLINAMNFIDNMDGLAAGTAMLATFFFLFVAAFRGQYFVAALSAATCGTACGFLLFNAPPAKIFMGDGGSHFLGYTLSIIGIMTTFYVPDVSSTPAPLLIPLFVLGVPLADAVAVVLIRLRLHVPIYKGDNRHISHRFVKLGLSRPQAVLLVLLLCFIVGATGLMLIWLPPIGTFLAFALVTAVFAIISIIQFYVPEATQNETK